MGMGRLHAKKMPTRQDSSGIFKHAPLGRMFNNAGTKKNQNGVPIKQAGAGIIFTSGLCRHYFYCGCQHELEGQGSARSRQGDDAAAFSTVLSEAKTRSSKIYDF